MFLTKLSGHPMFRTFFGLYAGAHFGKSLFWHAGEVLFAFYLTEICGLSAWSMGLVISASQLANALTDMTVGRFLTRLVTSTAAASQVQMAGGLASAAAFLVFAQTGLLPTSKRLMVAVVSLLAFRIAYSFYDVPQNAILAFATRSLAQRSQLVALRYVFSNLAHLTVALAFMPLLASGSLMAKAQAFHAMVIFLTAVAVLTATGLFLVGWRRDDAAMHRVTAQHANASVIMALRKKVWALMLASLMLAVGVSTFTRLEPYVASFAFTSFVSGAALMIFASFGGLVSQPLWAWLAQRSGLGKTQWVAFAVLVLGLGCYWLPSSRLGITLAIGSFLYGFGAGGVMMCLWVRLSEACQLKPGATTFLMGVFTFFSKSGSALAALTLAWGMQNVAYRTSLPVLISAITVLPLIAFALVQALSVKQRFQR